MISRYSEFRKKDVINLSDGRKLGMVHDLDLDLDCGRILTIVIPGPCRFLGLFGRDGDYVIPWSCIRKIGKDAILVDVIPENVKKKREKSW